MSRNLSLAKSASLPCDGPTPPVRGEFIESEGKPCYDLSRPRLGSTASRAAAVYPVHKSPSGRQQTSDTAQAVTVAGGSRDSRGAAIAGHLVEQAIKHVLEFRSHVERRSFLDSENAADCYAFARLPLPAKVIEVDRGSPESTVRWFDPGFGVQHQLLGGIEIRVGIYQKQRLTRHPVQERIAAAP